MLCVPLVVSCSGYCLLLYSSPSRLFVTHTSQIPSVLFVTAQRADAAVSGLHHGRRGVAPAPRLQLYVRCAGPCRALGGCRAPVSGASVAQEAV